MDIKVFLKWTDIDKNGNIISETPFKEANSIVQQMYDLIHTHFIATANDIKDTGNTDRTLSTKEILASNGTTCTYKIQLTV